MTRLIETDSFPIEFLSPIAERESWRKEIHRPIYHIHKWWANWLGSVFRGILLGCVLSDYSDFQSEFFKKQNFASTVVFDPFMGSGTTIGEAHKLGLTALGRDINPVAVQAVRVAFGALDKRKLQLAFEDLSYRVSHRLRSLYSSTDSRGRPCDVLYYFWVMQAVCPHCENVLDLFSTRIFARNAYPGRKPGVHLVCPSCGAVSPSTSGQKTATCKHCKAEFQLETGMIKGDKAQCPTCESSFSILKALGGRRPNFRLYAKLVLTPEGRKEYLAATVSDQEAYENCSRQLSEELRRDSIELPTLHLTHGYNTRQAMNYGFTSWRDFFNDRQLLGLGLLHRAIRDLNVGPERDALLTLFSGLLEFNNLFTSYKGEGTGAGTCFLTIFSSLSALLLKRTFGARRKARGLS